MERDPYFPGQSAVALPVRDALRGTRALLERARKALVSAEPDLPSAGGNGHFAHRLERLAFEISRLLRLDHHERTEPMSGLAHFSDTERAAASFARAVRLGLARCFKRFGGGEYLVSETLIAAAYWSGLRKVLECDAPALLAAHLYRSLTRHHIAAHAPGTPLGMEDDDLDLVKRATFATMIWLLIERNEPQDNEDEIIALCADVAISLKAEIDQAEHDPQALAKLMASYADVI